MHEGRLVEAIRTRKFEQVSEEVCKLLKRLIFSYKFMLRKIG